MSSEGQWKKIIGFMCSAVKWDLVKCSAVQCGVVQCSTVRCNTEKFSTVYCSALQCGLVKVLSGGQCAIICYHDQQS